MAQQQNPVSGSGPPGTAKPPTSFHRALGALVDTPPERTSGAPGVPVDPPPASPGVSMGMLVDHTMRATAGPQVHRWTLP